MLYATTRSKTDSYTAHKTLHTDRAPDGGFYIPYRMPVLDKHQILELKNQSFSQTVAQILNLFFPAQLTAWDVDCCIGKTAAQPVFLNQKVTLVKLWDNPGENADYLIRRLYERLCANEAEAAPTDWAVIAIGIAINFGIYSILQGYGISQMDIAVSSGDFSAPMAAWYARSMGLPVGRIICACNENSAPWDFLHRGELNTALAQVTTELPELDIPAPSGLERLVFATLGYDETKKLVAAMEKKGAYLIHPDMMQQLNKGMFVSVIGKGRPEAVITSVYKSTGCVIDPYTAASYGSLQDYRAKAGENSPTVLLWERSPVSHIAAVEKATGLTKEEIRKIIMTV